MFSCEHCKDLRTPIAKKICERLLLIVVIYCMKIEWNYSGTRLAFCFILNLKVTLLYLLSFVFIHFITRSHLVSLIVIFYYSLSFVVARCHSFVTRCHPLSFIVTRCPTRCHSLYYSLSFVLPLIVICYHSLLFVVTRYTSRCHSLYCSSVFLYTIFQNWA